MKRSLHNSVWRHRDLRLVAAGRAVSFLGDEVAIVALLLRLHDSGAGTTGVAALLLAAAAPTALLAPWAGMLADRVDSRRLLVACGLVQAGLCVGLAFAASLGAVLLLVVALQAVQAAAGPAWAALVPDIVGRDETGRAMGALQSLTLMAGVAGPAIAGLLVATAGTAAPLLVDGLTFLVLAGVASQVRTRRGGSAAGVGRPSEGRPLDGFRAIRSDALLLPVVVGLLAFVVCGEITNVVEVFLVRDVLAAGPTAFGLLGAVFSVGAAAGALAAGRATDDVTRARVAVAAAVVLGLLTALAGASPHVVVFGALWATVGATVGLLSVSVSTLVAVRAPAAHRGQVIAALSGSTRACSLLATALGGVLGLVAGPRVVFVVAGTGALAVAAVMGVFVRRALPAVASAQRDAELLEASAVEG